MPLGAAQNKSIQFDASPPFVDAKILKVDRSLPWPARPSCGRSPRAATSLRPFPPVRRRSIETWAPPARRDERRRQQRGDAASGLGRRIQSAPDRDEPGRARHRLRRHRHQPALYAQDGARSDRRASRCADDPGIAVADPVDAVPHHHGQIRQFRHAHRQRRRRRHHRAHDAARRQEAASARRSSPPASSARR